MSKRKPAKAPRRKIPIEVLVALIGTAGVIIAAILSSPLWVPVLERLWPTPTAPAPSVAPTLTTAALPTDTPAPVTLAPAAETAIPTPVLTLMDELRVGCLSVSRWQPADGRAPTPAETSCWDFGAQGVVAREGGLVMLVSSPTVEQTVGLMLALPENATLTFKLRIDQLETPQNNQLGNLGFGVVPAGPPQTDTPGRLLYQVEFAGRASPVFLKTQERGESSAYLTQRYTRGIIQSIAVRVRDIELTIWADDQVVLGPIPVPHAQRFFWLGYRVPAGGALSANLSEFSLTVP